jgi:glycosyltransferase involved in cell wall biosynthesis
MSLHMHVAFNGYFWERPRTGSGQYLRRLWGALNSLAPLSGHSKTDHNTFTMLLPPEYRKPSSPDDAVPEGPHSHVVYGRVMPLVGARVGNFDKLWWEQWGVARMARQQRAQLLHVPYLTAPAPLPGLKSCPVVVTAHDVIPWVIPAYAGSTAARLYFAMAAASVKRADLILADSEASRLDAIKVLGLSPGRVRTVYLGVQQRREFTPHELREVRTRYGLPEHYAFYLGGFDTRKSVPLLLRAWRAVSDSLCDETHTRPLLAIGGSLPRPGGVNPDVMAEAGRLGLTRPDAPVRFLGPVSEEDKALLMAAARLFIYPSAYEGFGLDPLEAMSVGCPVVSSSGGSLKEVVGDAGLLVPPHDERALAEAIVSVWRNPTLLAALSQKGRERAKQFTWQRTASETYALYAAVLRRRTNDERRRTAAPYVKRKT